MVRFAHIKIGTGPVNISCEVAEIYRSLRECLLRAAPRPAAPKANRKKR